MNRIARHSYQTLLSIAPGMSEPCSSRDEQRARLCLTVGKTGGSTRYPETRSHVTFSPDEQSVPGPFPAEATPAPVEPNRPRFCTHCGETLQPSDKFCSSCGNRVMQQDQ